MSCYWWSNASSSLPLSLTHCIDEVRGCTGEVQPQCNLSVGARIHSAWVLYHQLQSFFQGNKRLIWLIMQKMYNTSANIWWSKTCRQAFCANFSHSGQQTLWWRHNNVWASALSFCLQLIKKMSLLYFRRKSLPAGRLNLSKIVFSFRFLLMFPLNIKDKSQNESSQPRLGNGVCIEGVLELSRRLTRSCNVLDLKLPRQLPYFYPSHKVRFMKGRGLIYYNYKWRWMVRQAAIFWL